MALGDRRSSALDRMLADVDARERRRTMPIVGGSGSERGSMPTTGPEAGRASDRPTGDVPLSGRRAGEGDTVQIASMSGGPPSSRSGDSSGFLGGIGDAVGGAADWLGDNADDIARGALPHGLWDHGERVYDNLRESSPGDIGGMLGQTLGGQFGIGSQLGQWGRDTANNLFGGGPSTGGSSGPSVEERYRDTIGGGGGGQEEAAMPPGRYGGPPSSRAGGMDPLDALDGRVNELEQEANALEQDYGEQKQELRDMFSMSETPEERAQIAFMLEDLDARRDAASEAIAGEYSAAREDIGAVVGEMRQQAPQAGATVAANYNQGAEAARQGRADTQAEYSGGGVGVGATEGDGRVSTSADVMQQRATSEGDYARRQANIAADDAAWLQDTLAAEAPAQQGALQRAIAMQQGQAQREHAQQVNQRIAQDRRTLAQSLTQLEGQERSQRADLLQSAAEIAARQREQRAQREFEREQQGGDAGSMSQELRGMSPSEQGDEATVQFQQGNFATLQTWIDSGVLHPDVAAYWQQRMDDRASEAAAAAGGQ